MDDQIQRLKDLLKRCISYAERSFEEPSHKGFCGPESGCDNNCAINSWISKDLNAIDKEINSQVIEYPRVGVATFVLKETTNGYKFLLGKRKGSHGEGEYALPGGHLDFKESVHDCTLREIKEETGLEDLKPFLDLGWGEKVVKGKFNEDKHYITIYNAYLLKYGEPKLIEPEKNEGWEWYSLFQDPPSPLFGNTESKLKLLKSKCLEIQHERIFNLMEGK